MRRDCPRGSDNETCRPWQLSPQTAAGGRANVNCLCGGTGSARTPRPRFTIHKRLLTLIRIPNRLNSPETFDETPPVCLWTPVPDNHAFGCRGEGRWLEDHLRRQIAGWLEDQRE